MGRACGKRRRQGLPGVNYPDPSATKGRLLPLLLVGNQVAHCFECRLVHVVVLALADSEHQHQDRVVINLVDQSVPLLAQLDLVATAQLASQFRSGNARIVQPLCQQLLQVRLDRAVQRTPLGQRGGDELQRVSARGRRRAAGAGQA